MYELTVKTIESTNEIIKIGSRDFAEKLANQYYNCVDVYAVELISLTTGELLYLKSKG
jgi:hypothetical protein